MSGTIRITGDPDGDGRGYTVTVDGQAWPQSDAGGDDGVRGDGNIYGDIGSGTDSFTYSGTVVDADLPPNSALYIDGEQVDPAALGGSGSYTSPVPEPPETEEQSEEPTATPPTEEQPAATEETETTNRPAQTTTIGGSAPDTLAWVVALVAIGAAVYMSQS